MEWTDVILPESPADSTESSEAPPWWSDDHLLEILGIIQGGASVFLLVALIGLIGRHAAGWW
jgi:hypothetical protein